MKKIKLLILIFLLLGTGYAQVYVANFINEDFESNNLLPYGWTTDRFSVRPNGGIDNSQRLAVNLYYAYQSGWVKTSYVEMGANPVLNFHYRVVNYPDYPNTTTFWGYVAMKVRITQDFGATWELIHFMDVYQHVQSLNYAVKNIDVSAYANKTCMVEIEVLWYGNDFFVDLDNVMVGTPPANDLEAVSINGTIYPSVNTTSSYTIAIKNSGYITQNEHTYSVKLMKEGDVELASVPGTPIGVNQTRYFTLNWTPETEGITNLYGRVDLTGDENPANNTTGNFQVDVQPAGIIGVDIGTGTDGARMPIDFFWLKSVVQTLYFPSEIGVNGGVITGLVYKSKLQGERPNKAIRVWIGETDRDNLSAGWVDPTTLTQVFDGTLSFSSVPGADVFITFNNPYTYQGGNLVVYVYKIDAQNYSQNDHFLCTTQPNSGRSRVYTRDSGTLDPLNPQPGTVNHSFPNITLKIDIEGTGSLTGVVSEAGGVIAGAKVQLVGYDFSTLTNQTGVYLLPCLVPGNYTIEISKTGYFTTTASVVIEADLQTVQDITLLPIQTFTVSGKITGSNMPNGLEGILITLSGYETYTAITDEAGDYFISGVYDGHTYDVSIRVSEYMPFSGTVAINGADETYDIMLKENLYAPTNVKAEKNGDNVLVTWNEAAVKHFRYDSGINSEQIGITFQTKFMVMGSIHRASATLNKMSWFLTTENIHTEVDLYIFALTSSGMPNGNHILFSAHNVPSTPSQWCEHIFPEYVEAPNGFFIGVSPSNGGFLSLGTDAPNAEYPFRPNTHFYCGNYNDNDWYAQTIQKNLMIRAEGYDNGKSATFGYTISQFSSFKEVGEESKGTTGYNIYRLIKGDAEENWILLSDTETGLSYTDNQWNTLLDATVYQYAVKARYTDGLLSAPKLSNDMPKGMEVGLQVHITTNSGEPATGAVVILKNKNGNPNHIYTATSGPEGVLVQNVWRGMYDISIRLLGYQNYSAENLEITIEGQAHTAILEEVPYPVTTVTATIMGNNVVVEWTEPSVTSKVFRYDNGVCTSQLGFEQSAPRGVMGSCHRVNATLNNMSWYLTDNVNPNPTQVNLWVFDLDAQGMPTNNILYSRLGVNSTKLEWNTFEFPDPVEAPNGFFIALSHPNTFLSLGTTIPDVEYPFPPQTHFYCGDFTQLDFTALDGAFNVNFMIRAEGYEYGKTTTFGKPSKATIGYNIYRLEKEQEEEEWTQLGSSFQGLTYTDENWSELPAGTYQYAVKAVYTYCQSDATLSNPLLKPIGIRNHLLSELVLYPNPFKNEIFISHPEFVKSVKMTNITGQKIEKPVFNGNSIATGNLSSGVYFIEIETITGEKGIYKMVKE